MTLNDLLRSINIDPREVLVLRHTPKEGKLNKVLRRLSTERPKTFNAYQQSQFQRQEQKLAKAKFVASFIGHEKDKAVFVGLYENKGARPVSREEYWRIPENIELRKFGMRGFTEDDSRRSVLWFNLKPTSYYSQLKDKLVIGWPKNDARHWDRFAPEREWPILNGLDTASLGIKATPAPLNEDVNDGVPRRSLTTAYRILRDTAKSLEVKRLHNFECQICGKTFELPSGERYAEAHHIRPLGGQHKGPDRRENILCVCPNHHAELDYGVCEIVMSSLRAKEGHVPGAQFVEYHNNRVSELRAMYRG